MKIFFQIFFIITGFLAAVPVNCAESYRVHFEINIENDTVKRTLNSSSDVILGMPLTFETGDQILSLVFSIEPETSNMYLLKLSLFPRTKPKTALNSPPLIQTFQAPLVGRENGPLEFQIEQNNVKVHGVVAFSLRH